MEARDTVTTIDQATLGAEVWRGIVLAWAWAADSAVDGTGPAASRRLVTGNHVTEGSVVDLVVGHRRGAHHELGGGAGGETGHDE